MIKIDAHVHVGPRGGLMGQTDQEIIARMDSVGVEKAVIFPYTEGTFSNQPIMDYAAAHPDRLIPFCAVNPWEREAAAKKAHDCFAQGYRGIKLHPSGSGYRLSDPGLINPIFDVISQFSVPVIIHGAADLLNAPLEFDRICRRYPNVPVIMAHSGYFWLVDEAIEVAQENPNLYLEVSRIPLFEIKQIVAALPPEKIIWGTDAPFVEYAAEFRKMAQATDSPQAYNLIMGGNMARLLGEPY